MRVPTARDARQDRRLTRPQQGFTLIELMIVAAIVGTLAGIATPGYGGYLAKSPVAEAFTLTDGLKPEVVEYMSVNAQGPSNGGGGFPKAAGINGKYIAAVQLGGTYPPTGRGDACTVTDKFHNKGVSGGISGGSVTLQASLGNGSVAWKCSSTDIKQQYLPASCRGAG